MKSFKDLFKLPRLSEWMVATVLLLLGIWLVAPQNLMVVVYKVCLVTLFVVIGYWADRRLFPNASPNDSCLLPEDKLAWATMLRRAIIILAVVLGGTQAL